MKNLIFLIALGFLGFSNLNARKTCDPKKADACPEDYYCDPEIRECVYIYQ